jgi:hypothetical protein
MAEQGWQLTFNLGPFSYPDYESMALSGSTKKLRTLLGAGVPSRGDGLHR